MNNLFSDDFTNVYPFLSKNPNILLETMEDNKYCIRNPKLPKPLVFNEATYKILDYCDNKNSLQNIINIESMKHPDVAYQKIKMDIMNILYPLWKLKIIMFRNGVLPFGTYMEKQFDKNILFKVEYNPCDIIKEFNSEKDIVICEEGYSMTKADLNISFMYNSRIFFSLIVNQCKAVTLSLIPYCVCQPYIDIVYFNSDYICISNKYRIEYNVLNQFLMWCIDFYNRETKIKPVKHCIYLYFRCPFSVYKNNMSILKQFFMTDDQELIKLNDYEIILEKRIIKDNSTR